MPSREVPAAASWWRSAVLYQVYLRSFADADGPLGECPDPLTLAADEGVVVGPDR